MPEKFEKIYNDVIKVLDGKLPSYLTYHCTAHTQYVMEKAEYIANKEGVSKKNIFLLKVAALYHDIGFTVKAESHEEIGTKIAVKDLRKYKFSEKDIEKICGMIMATKIPQQPKNHLEQILADADLEYLATNLFRPIGDNLYKELKHFNKSFTRKKWNDIQISFMEDHSYHTAYCKRYKEFRKRRNLEGLKK